MSILIVVAGLFAVTIMTIDDYHRFQNGVAYNGMKVSQDGVHRQVSEGLASEGVVCVEHSFPPPGDADASPVAQGFVAVLSCVAESQDCRVRFRFDLLYSSPTKSSTSRDKIARLAYTPAQSVVGAVPSDPTHTLVLQSYMDESKFSSINKHVKAPLALNLNSDGEFDPSGCYREGVARKDVEGKVVVITAAGCHHWMGILNLQRAGAAAIILDFHDGSDNLNPLSVQLLNKSFRCDVRNNFQQFTCNYNYLDSNSCPAIQPDPMKPHYNPPSWQSADSSCDAAKAAGALGGPPDFDHDGNRNAAEMAYTYTSCCWAFMQPYNQTLQRMEFDASSFKIIISMISGGKGVDIGTVAKFWETKCRKLEDLNPGNMNLGLDSLFGLRMSNTCVKMSLDVNGDFFRSNPLSKGSGIFGYVAHNWDTIFKDASIDDSVFPSKFAASQQFWAPSVGDMLRLVPSKLYNKHYMKLPATRQPACNDRDIINGVYSGLIDMDNFDSFVRRVFVDISVIKDPDAKAYLGSNYSGTEQGRNRFMCALYSMRRWETGGMDEAIWNMYGVVNIPIYASKDGSVGKLIRQHRQNQSEATVEITAGLDTVISFSEGASITAKEVNSTERRNNTALLPGPWRVKFDGLPLKYSGYYYKQPSNFYRGCEHDSSRIQPETHQKNVYPRAVYRQINGVASASFLYSITAENFGELNISTSCTDDPQYSDPLNTSSNLGCDHILPGSTANRAYCRMRHVRDSFLWDNPSGVERGRTDLFEKCPSSCGYHRCLLKTLWIVADDLCGHRTKDGAWQTFYFNSALSSGDLSRPTRRFKKGGGNDLIELPHKSWARCYPDPTNPFGMPLCQPVSLGAHDGGHDLGNVTQNPPVVVLRPPDRERSTPLGSNMKSMFVQSPHPCHRVSQADHQTLRNGLFADKFNRKALHGFVTARGANGANPASRYFDLCGLFGNIVSDSQPPTKVRFRVSIGPHQPKCGGVPAVACAHPRLQDLPSSYSSVFPANSVIGKSLQQNLLSSVTPLNDAALGVGFVNQMLRKFDASVRIVLALGASDAREVLWDQRLSDGTSTAGLDHSKGNLTLNYLPPGVSSSVNATTQFKLKLQQRLGQLMTIGGSQRKYMSAMRGALKQAQQAIDSVPQLASMLRESGTDMTSFIDQISVLKPDAGDLSKKFTNAIKGPFFSDAQGESLHDYFKGVAKKTRERAAAIAERAHNLTEPIVTGVDKTTTLSQDAFTQSKDVFAKLLRTLPDDETLMPEWRKAASAVKETLFTQDYIFAEIIDVALSVVPLRVQVTCVCDLAETSLPKIGSEGPIHEEDPQRVWLHSNDNQAAVYGFIVRHIVCCDAEESANHTEILAQFASSSDTRHSAAAYEWTKRYGLLILGITSIFTIAALVAVEKDARGWSFPMPVNFLTSRSQGRTVTFTIGAISIFIFDFVFGIFGMFLANNNLPVPTTGDWIHLSGLVHFCWCLIVALLVTPLPSCLQSKNKRAGHIIGLLLSCAYVVIFIVFMALGSTASTFEALKWVPSFMCSCICVAIFFNRIRRKSVEYLSFADTANPSDSIMMTEVEGEAEERVSTAWRTRVTITGLSGNEHFQHVAKLLQRQPDAVLGADDGADTDDDGTDTKEADVPFWRKPFQMIWDADAIKILTRRDLTFTPPPKFLAVLGLTTSLLTIIMIYWWCQAWNLRVAALKHLDGEDCYDDERALPFSDDDAAPTFMGVLQLPLISGDSLGLSCDENIELVNALYATMVLSGLAVYFGNVVLLVYQVSTVKIKLLQLYRGDRSFLTQARASQEVDESKVLLQSIKYGGWQAAYSVAAYFVTATVLVRAVLILR